MTFEILDIPDELIEAQEKNELVIFVGAGVSKALPSNLPLFEDFASDVERESKVPRIRKDDTKDRDEDTDQYLGRVQESKPEWFREFVREAYGKQVPCNSLHNNIIRLFCPEQLVRLVTTNFDTLLSKAAQSIKVHIGNSYCYDALPGDDRFSFDGLAHIHGIASSNSDKLVVTSRDFSSAYIAHGPGYKFITSVAKNHPILFIGYSLNDAMFDRVLKHSFDRREMYAICKRNDAWKWHGCSVFPIEYDVMTSGEKHKELKLGLKEWADETQSKCKIALDSETDYAERKETIKSLAVLSPGDDTDPSGVLMSALGKLPFARFFTLYATDPSWLLWLDDKKRLASLFDSHAQLTEPEDQLAGWVAGKFAIRHPAHVVELVHRHGGNINPRLWRLIVWEITNSKDRPTPDVLNMWVNILLNQVPPDERLDRSLDFLHPRLNWPEHQSSILKLISRQLEPIATTRGAFPSLAGEPSKFKYEYELGLRGQEYYLQETWVGLRPHLDEIWRWLLPVAEKHLSAAYQMNIAFGRAKEGDDLQSFWRSAIEDHEQDKNLRRSFDVLIDVARDILEYLLSTASLREQGKHLVESWFVWGVPLLKRIAIHGVAYGDLWTPDEKINWLLERDLIYRHLFKHETFQVIKSALAGCSEQVVERLVEVAMSRPVEGDEGDEKAMIRAYEKYNLLNWMKQHALKSKSVAEAFDKIQADYPDFKQREYPDLDHWTGGAALVTPKSPLEPEALLEMRISEAAEMLSTFKIDEPRGWDDSRQGLMNILTNATLRSFEWSLRLANELAGSEVKQPDVWYHLIRGWTESPLSDAELIPAVEFLTERTEIHSRSDAACALLEKRVRQETEISDEVLEKMENLSDVIWAKLVDADPEAPTRDQWLTTAINHGAGNLAEFWIQALHRRWRATKDTWTGIPDDYRKRLESIIDCEGSYAAQLARTVLASRLQYFCWRDEEWTRTHLIPLLDYGIKEARAEQAWHGYLVWGEIPPQLIPDLKQVIPGAVDKLGDTGEQLRDKLFALIADITLMDESEPPVTEWLYEILKQERTRESDRKEFASRIGFTLREASDEFISKQWSRWLKDYWTDRANSIPVALVETEADEIMEWIPSLKPVFSEAVEVACQTQQFDLKQTSFFSALDRAELAKTFPQDVVKLLVHVLMDAGETTLQDYYLRPMWGQLSEALDEESLRELKNYLLRLGVL